MKKVTKRLLQGILLLAVIVGGIALWGVYVCHTTNPYNYKTVGDIPTPGGYERIQGEDPAYARFLRDLPLKERGSKIQLYTGGKSHGQALGYAVVDIPLISNAEQCADACMRLRSEYLFKAGKYNLIRFKNVNGQTMAYNGGNSRQNFENYLKKVYNVASSFSLSRDLAVRPLSDIQPGDVFVYPAGRNGRQYGHAMLVLDVAQNKEGKKAFLMVSGNIPAREFHVLRNFHNLFRSPWFTLDEDAENIRLAVFNYKPSDLKHF